MNSFFVLARRVVGWLAIFTFVVCVSPRLALAQAESAAAVAESAGLGNADLLSIIGTIINVFLGLLGVVFLILIIYAGFRWMTAGGSEEQVNSAKKILINATVGLVITLSAYAIATFVINTLDRAINGGGGTTPSGTVSIERFSGSLGGGAIQDHYPLRNQTGVARNANIIVTFREAMDLPSFIDGYDTNGTPTDLSDDIAATSLNTDNVKIFVTADGQNSALTEVAVSFTDDLRTLVFNPTPYLGSATEDVSYTVILGSNIKGADGADVFSAAADHYEWSFITGTVIDTEPPRVVSVSPAAGGSYAKNIAVQVTFDEAVDPVSAAGIRQTVGGFDNLQVTGAAGTPEPGTYAISNGYKTVTFTTSALCGANSCGENVYCLPGGQAISVLVQAATVGVSPPATDIFPYDGVVDVAANSLDGNGDGSAGDDYQWQFNTTDQIFLSAPVIESISPGILGSNVALDQAVTMIFNDVLLTSTVNNENLSLTNTELSSGKSHELWYRFDSTLLTAAGDVVTNSSQLPAKSLITVPHGVFLESIDGKTYVYGTEVTQGLRNQYQNCYRPAAGPDAGGGQCAVNSAAPYCCNGVAQATACNLF